jgi:hypothetical protein
MDPRRGFLLAFSSLALGAGIANPATALTEEEVACMLALKANTIPALEDFLRRFPPGPDEGSSCVALALAALLQFRPVDDETLDPRVEPTPSPY